MHHPRPKLHYRSALGMLREALETLVLVGAIYALVNLASARFVVEGDSMQPNFHSDQYLIISRINYLVGAPERGDIVVFHYPLEPESDFIKRVIGVPGDVVEITNQQVYVNAQALNEPYINEPCDPSHCRDDRWELDAGQYFVMGDNRNASRDSRAFGPVDVRYFVGEALVRYWPPSEWAVVNRVGYPDLPFRE